MRDDGVLLDTTLAFCPVCRETEQAFVVAREGGVYLERVCRKSGTVDTRILADYRWYLERAREPGTVRRLPRTRDLEKGCPRDCGLCRCHTATPHLPVISITNLCNLNCPICFTYNRPDLAYCKSPAEMSAILGHLQNEVGSLDLINITGGEPSLHPELFELLRLCTGSGFIGRVTMNTNGLRIAADPDFALHIKEAGVQVVLSLDTLDPARSVVIHGRDITAEKQKTLEVLEELGIPTTILTVCIKGVNEEESAELVDRYLMKHFVRGVTIQNMTFTGENGRRFQPREHITIDEVEGLLEKKGGFSRQDFFPLGSYHPLCYSVAYYLVEGGRRLSLSRLVDKGLLTAATENSYLLDGGDELARNFRAGIDRLWAAGEDEDTIAMLRRFIEELYPTGLTLSKIERRERAEKMVKMIYIHPHMDEDNFDLARVSRCGDVVPDENGRMIPACSYNLLFRQQDARFWKAESQ